MQREEQSGLRIILDMLLGCMQGVKYPLQLAHPAGDWNVVIIVTNPEHRDIERMCAGFIDSKATQRMCF